MRSISKIRNAAAVWVAVWALGITTPSAEAQYFVDPGSGTKIFTVADDDVVTRNLGFTGSFFGSPTSTVDVSSNGHLNFSGDSSPSNQPMPFGLGHINALWDDLLLSGAAGTGIYENVSPGIYYASTFKKVETFNTGDQFTFQVVWIGSATTLGGFSFLPNDIAITYPSIGAHLNDNSATAGLDAGDGATFVPLPGTTNGEVTDATKSLLPTKNQFTLYRPDGFGGYNASTQTFVPTTVPEGSTILLMLSGLVPCVCLFLRGRNHKRME